MKKAFAHALAALAKDPRCWLLTGDMGFNLLEPLRQSMGARFINCGVAEQNMVGVAAGLAREGMRVFVYSIGPFCYARPYEQVRNDLAMTGLPVCLAGNGGGYFYGCLGPSHHALEDCAALNALGVKTLIPAFAEDVAPLLERHAALPCYLRLGREVRPQGASPPPLAPWRCLLHGDQGALAAMGPLAGAAWAALAPCPEAKRPAVWAVAELPLTGAPPAFCAAAHEKNLYIFEDHVLAGGLGMQLVYALARDGVRPRRIVHRHALGYPSQRYGSQDFHHKECGLDQASMRALAAPGFRP